MCHAHFGAIFTRSESTVQRSLDQRRPELAAGLNKRRPDRSNGGRVRPTSDIRIEPTAAGLANGWLTWPMAAAIANLIASLSLWRLPIGPTLAEIRRSTAESG